MKVAEKILEQLGGQKFIAMTGANHFVADGNTLRMALPKNASKANRLYITLDATDTYTNVYAPVRTTAGRPSRRPAPSKEGKVRNECKKTDQPLPHNPIRV